MDGSSISKTLPSIKPRVRSRNMIARCHARDLRDIRFLAARVLDVAQLGGDLIDFGAGNRNHAHEVECALLNPELLFTSRERTALQADADSHRGLELACREELAEVPAWTDLAKCSTWAELAEVARLRDSIA
jgi:hypothetical protein